MYFNVLSNVNHAALERCITNPFKYDANIKPDVHHDSCNVIGPEDYFFPKNSKSKQNNSEESNVDFR